MTTFLTKCPYAQIHKYGLSVFCSFSSLPSLSQLENLSMDHYTSGLPLLVSIANLWDLARLQMQMLWPRSIAIFQHYLGLCTGDTHLRCPWSSPFNQVLMHRGNMWLTYIKGANTNKVCFTQTDLQKYCPAAETCFDQTFVCKHQLTTGNNTQWAHKRSVKEARYRCAVAAACDKVAKG